MNQDIIKKLICWIKEYVESAHSEGIVLGMSGGKDSFIVAKLCCEAIGKDKIFGVIMPNGEMSDKSDAIKECELLGIKYTTININDIYLPLINKVNNIIEGNLSDVTTINTPPRIRMTCLYAIAGSLNYLVANTSNLSETMVGYTTKWGDNVGDFYPLISFTKSEVCEMGILLGLPDELVNKAPSDGLSGKSDEDKLGFSYEELDDYIRNGIKGKNFETILKKHLFSAHKRNGISKLDVPLKNYFND